MLDKLFIFLIFILFTFKSFGAVQFCQKEVDQVLKKWGVSGKDWSNRPTVMKDTSKKASPTKTFGKWVVQEAGPKFVKLTLFNPGMMTQVMFNPSCKRVLNIAPFQPKTDKGLGWTDKELEKMIKKNKKGILYGWSPSMALSIIGLPHMEALSKELGIPVHYVLDPNADPKEVKRLMKKFKGKDYFRRNRSLELLMRNFDMHHPVLAFYENSKILSHIKFGYEKKEGFKRDIRGVFK
jgi:hypothetical protein